jgi:hypothetical protein
VIDRIDDQRPTTEITISGTTAVASSTSSGKRAISNPTILAGASPVASELGNLTITNTTTNKVAGGSGDGGAIDAGKALYG